MESELEQKVISAKTLASAGVKQQEIANRFSVSPRTVRRWLSLELSPEVELQFNEVSKAHREQFIKVAWKVVFEAAKRVVQAFENGEITAREAATIGGIYFDKMTAAEGFEKTTGKPANNQQVIIQLVSNEDQPRKQLSDGEVIEVSED